MGALAATSVENPREVQRMRHQAQKPPVRLRDLAAERTSSSPRPQARGVPSSPRLQARSGDECGELPEDVCGHNAGAYSLLTAGDVSGELSPRRWRRWLVAVLGCAACNFVAIWWGVGLLRQPDADIISPEVRRALAIFWVEALEGGLSGAAAMVRGSVLPGEEFPRDVISARRTHTCARTRTYRNARLLWLRTTMNYQTLTLNPKTLLTQDHKPQNQVVQVLTLLWLRTTMNYQYKHGGSFCAALSHLYKEGGVARLYAGVRAHFLCAPV
jgi:hypothetical protein